MRKPQQFDCSTKYRFCNYLTQNTQKSANFSEKMLVLEVGSDFSNKSCSKTEHKNTATEKDVEVFTKDFEDHYKNIEKVVQYSII